MKKLGQLAVVWAVFIFLTGTLWAAYKFSYRYEVKGVIITESSQETFLKMSLGAHKGLMKDDYLRKEQKKYEDHILEMKKGRITKVRRTYHRYQQQLKAFQSDKLQRGRHQTEGLTFLVQRTGSQDKVTLLNKKAKIFGRSVKEITLEDELISLSHQMPKRSVNTGYSWSLSRKATRKFLGDDFDKRSQATVNLKFVRRAFHRGYRCAKIKVKIRIRGKHKIGAKVVMDAEGYCYYAIQEGIPISYQVKGNYFLDHKEVAPKGQTAYMKAKGPYKLKIIKDYRAPDIEDEEDE